MSQTTFSWTFLSHNLSYLALPHLCQIFWTLKPSQSLVIMGVLQLQILTIKRSLHRKCHPILPNFLFLNESLEQKYEIQLKIALTHKRYFKIFGSSSQNKSFGKFKVHQISTSFSTTSIDQFTSNASPLMIMSNIFLCSFIAALDYRKSIEEKTLLSMRNSRWILMSPLSECVQDLVTHIR